MSTTTALVTDKTAWIRDLVFLAFPEGEARERVLIDLVQQFSKMDPEDPEWLRYKLSIVECRALENTARGLSEAATEQARLRGVTREIPAPYHLGDNRRPRNGLRPYKSRRSTAK
jgi:hypothetical protein